jgi:hypothetical protein
MTCSIDQVTVASDCTIECLIKNIKFNRGLSAIMELQTPTKLLKKELNKISDLQGVLKDFTVTSALHMKI